MVDPSAAMLERAIRHLSTEDEDVASRVRLVKASGENAPEALGGAVFDAILCDGVLMYTRGDRIEHLSELLAARGVEPVAWYGVPLFSDGWTPDRPGDDPEDLVLQAELMASQRDPYRRLRRLFHLVSRRPN